MKDGEHIENMEEVINVHSVLIWRHEGKKPLGRPSHKWEDNIRMDPKGLEHEGMDWIRKAQHKVL
jgi:hypothetical protein